MNTNIFERISKIAETKGFRSINDFALNGLGYKSSEKINRLKDPSKKPSYEIVFDISNKFEDVNVRWLVTGENENFTNKIVEPSTIYATKTDINLDKQKIPLYNKEAIAGVTPIFSDINNEKPIDYLHIPNAPKCDGAIYASGDSMYPLVKSGDITAYKIIPDIINDIYWGQMYIVDIEIAGDTFQVIKYIKKGKDSKHILLVSENKHHQEKEILLSKVRGLAQVKIIVRIP